MYPAFVAEDQDDAAAETEMASEEGGQVVKAVKKPRKLTKNVEVADIGCGFGGLLMALGPLMSDTLCLGQCCPPTYRHRQPANTRNRPRDQDVSHRVC